MAEITIDLDKCEGAGQCAAYCSSNAYKLGKMEE
jgi:NAD-dependent dihydropyrimidine dehydrogenase PreA subunit